MPRALADAALTRPRAMLTATLAALVLAAALAVWGADRVPLAPSEAARSESERTADELAAAIGQEPGPGVLIVTMGRAPVRSAVYEVALDVISSRAETAPGVAEVRRGPVSRDGRTTALEVYFRDDDPRAQQEAVGEFHDELDPGPLDLTVGGQAAVLRDARDDLWGELGLLELLALPVTALALVLTLGLRLAAGPVLAAATGLLGAVGLTGVANEVVPLSVLGILPAGVIAITLGIESCLVLNDRYRDEAAALGPGEEAMRRTLDTTGRGVVTATLGAASVAASLALIPVLDARAVGLAAVLAALITGAVALVAMPSLLALSRPTEADGEESATAIGDSRFDEGRERGAGYRIESLLAGRRPVAAVLAAFVVAALLAIASPVLRAEPLPIEATGLPDDAEAHRAEIRSTAELGALATAPVLASAGPAGQAELKSYRFDLASAPGVAQARGPSAVDSDRELLRVGTEERPGSVGARDAVEAIRDVPAPVAVSVGGRDAEALDASRAFLGWLPIAAGAAVLILALLLYALLRPATASRLRTALPALALAVVSMLPAAAALGALVLVFQDGTLTDPLDYTPQGGPTLGAAIATVGAVAAASAARTVHLAAEFAGARRLGFPSRVAVPLAAELTLPGAATATLVAGAATIVLAGAELVAAKEFGLATAAGLLLDLVLVRVLLVPALARVSQ
jgi:putative drug exporter of the RND superfamily